MYDLAIIGAGVNGCSVAHEFTKENKNVIIFDMNEIASGGSGAAGAFIAPSFAKSGELKELLGEAFVYSMKYYQDNFNKFFTKTKLLHIAKDKESSEILKIYKKDTNLEIKEIDKEFYNSLNDEAKAYENICIDAGVVDAKSTCRAMAKDAEFVKEKVDTLVYDDSFWIINDTYKAKSVLLASGAYESLIKEPYISVRGIWGHRIDIRTSTSNPYSIHQNVSISPSTDGELAIGATHDVHYHPQTATEPYDIQKGRDELLSKAARSIELKDVEVLRDFTGLRSGSVDYMPIVGQMVLSDETLECCREKIRVKKTEYDDFKYYPNLYMLNGNGGYGFVLAPFISKILTEFILNGKRIDDRLTPARFFHRWVKRLK